MDSCSFCAISASMPTSTYSVPSGPEAFFMIFVPCNDSSAILVVKALSLSAVSLPATSALPALAFWPVPRKFRASFMRASAAAICSMNEMPAPDFTAEPTAVIAEPSAGAPQTQLGGRFLDFGNRHFFSFVGVPPKASAPRNKVADNSTQTILRMQILHDFSHG